MEVIPLYYNVCFSVIAVRVTCISITRPSGLVDRYKMFYIFGNLPFFPLQKGLVRQALSGKEQWFVCYVYVSCNGAVKRSGYITLNDMLVDIEHERKKK